METIHNFYYPFFSRLNLSEGWTAYMTVILSLLSIMLLALTAQKITRAILVRLAHRYFRKTATKWDDFLVSRKVLAALAHLPAAYIVYQFHEFPESELLTAILYALARIYLVVLFTIAFIRLTKVVNDIYETTPIAPTRP
ncbi:MAG: hypothetical protein AB7D05_06130, partial [Mangrovibacterium sp.]